MNPSPSTTPDSRRQVLRPKSLIQRSTGSLSPPPYSPYPAQVRACPHTNQTLPGVRHHVTSAGPAHAASLKPDQLPPTESTASPINLRINTSIHMLNSSNLLCLETSPAQHAASLIESVLEALHRNSAGQCGVPMIDEDGLPRPINVQVDSSIVIGGSGNAVGSNKVIAEVLRQKSQLKRGRTEEDDTANTPAKRSCPDMGRRSDEVQ